MKMYIEGRASGRKDCLCVFPWEYVRVERNQSLRMSSYCHGQVLGSTLLTQPMPSVGDAFLRALLST